MHHHAWLNYLFLSHIKYDVYSKANCKMNLQIFSNGIVHDQIDRFGDILVLVGFGADL